MNRRLLRWVLAVLFISGFVLALSGCAPVRISKTEAWDQPDEVKVKLSRGDTQQKVRSVLGDPLIDAQNLGVEVYLHSGRDIYLDIVLVLLRLPIPFPGDRISVFTLVAYDENEVVKDIATNLWFPLHPPVNINENDFWITAGEFSFVNIHLQEPDTLLGPPISWKDLTEIAATKGSCSLVLVMGDCPMGKITLDNNLIADLSPAGDYCASPELLPPMEHHYFGTFIQKTISTGSHRLHIHQRRGGGNFETDFECASGETIYAELDAQRWVPDWIGLELEAEILISKSIPQNVVDMDKLRPIMWHQDRRYGTLNRAELDTFVKKAQAERAKEEKRAERTKAMEEKRDALWQLYLMQSTEENLVWLCRAADQGHASARNELGELYFYGSDQYRKFENIHFKADLSRACMWFYLADQSINITLPDSQVDLLFHLRYKISEAERAVTGMTADELEEAKKLVQFWLPGQCNADFYQHLGTNYMENPDLSQLCVVAEKVDADKDSFPARETLGHIYFYGLRGVEVDLPLAYMWYSLAANVYVQPLCDVMTPEQRDITEQLLVNWKPGQCERELLRTKLSD